MFSWFFFLNFGGTYKNCNILEVEPQRTHSPVKSEQFWKPVSVEPIQFTEEEITTQSLGDLIRVTEKTSGRMIVVLWSVRQWIIIEHLLGLKLKTRYH